MKDIKIEKLGEKEREVLLTCLDFDIENLSCQLCGEKTTYDLCSIMPSVNTKLHATILCESIMCMSMYFESVRKIEIKTCCKKRTEEIFNKMDKIIAYTNYRSAYQKLKEKWGVEK